MLPCKGRNPVETTNLKHIKKRRFIFIQVTSCKLFCSFLLHADKKQRYVFYLILQLNLLNSLSPCFNF